MSMCQFVVLSHRRVLELHWDEPAAYAWTRLELPARDVMSRGESAKCPDCGEPKRTCGHWPPQADY